jgi:hypothetical protein
MQKMAFEILLEEVSHLPVLSFYIQMHKSSGLTS